ncbi:membrane protein of unknown function [Pararobbsia alpina]|uniref:hypothetical protein n=1 Tax=Pararobbsia alpina TaxID=621374 RepID=UPI0039A41839
MLAAQGSKGDDQRVPFGECTHMYRSSTKMQPQLFDVWNPNQRSRDRVMGRSSDQMRLNRQNARIRQGDYDARIGPDMRARLQAPFWRRVSTVRSAAHPAAGWGVALGLLFAAGVHLWFGAGGSSTKKTEAMCLLATFFVGLVRVVSVNSAAIGWEVDGADGMPRAVRLALAARASLDAAVGNGVGFIVGAGLYCAWNR